MQIYIIFVILAMKYSFFNELAVSHRGRVI